jgi:hypothetical protein
MTMFGITHTANTKVGNDFVRGVSGGERKRVTIAEATLSFAEHCAHNVTYSMHLLVLLYTKHLRLLTR